jgi:hypothetical protein
VVVEAGEDLGLPAVGQFDAAQRKTNASESTVSLGVSLDC